MPRNNYDPHYLEIYDCSNDKSDSMWMHADVKITDGSDTWIVMGYKIVDGKLTLICETPAAHDELIKLIHPKEAE